ncbi:MAG: phosphatase PAP2 family protein [Bacilli bacterium]|nr:phosphatase PAP2 family protein [Bacilli bacterium]
MIWYPFELTSLFYLYKKDFNTYFKSISALIISLVIMHLIFIIYPTMVDRPVVDSFNSLTSLIVYITFKSDTPVNCFPSGHCIICFIMIFSFLKTKNMKLETKSIFIGINILIVLSTLFVKQHVLYDVFGALVLSFISFYFFSKFNIFKKLAKNS